MVSMRGAAAIVGVGQLPWYKRATAPEPEMKLALRAAADPEHTLLEAFPELVARVVEADEAMLTKAVLHERSSSSAVPNNNPVRRVPWIVCRTHSPVAADLREYSSVLSLFSTRSTDDLSTRGRKGSVDPPEAAIGERPLLARVGTLVAARRARYRCISTPMSTSRGGHA